MGGIELNRWWGEGKGLEHQQKFSLGSHWAAVGVQSGLSLNKKGRPAHSILSRASRTSVTYHRNSSLIHLLSQASDRVVP